MLLFTRSIIEKFCVFNHVASSSMKTLSGVKSAACSQAYFYKALARNKGDPQAPPPLKFFERNQRLKIFNDFNDFKMPISQKSYQTNLRYKVEKIGVKMRPQKTSYKIDEHQNRKIYFCSSQQNLLLTTQRNAYLLTCRQIRDSTCNKVQKLTRVCVAIKPEKARDAMIATYRLAV